MESLNIYRDLTEELGPSREEVTLEEDEKKFTRRREGDLHKMGENHRIGCIKIIEDTIDTIAKLTKKFYREHRATYQDISKVKEEGLLRIYMLVRTLDSQIHHSLSNMFRSSLDRFKNLLDYLSLGLAIDRSDNTDFDQMLPKRLYTTRLKAMITYSQVPIWMVRSVHPNRLMANTKPNLMRRAAFIYKVVTVLTRLVRESSLCLSRQYANRNPL